MQPAIEGLTWRGARIAYLVTSPIIYQAPLLRRLACERGLRVKTFFCSDMSTKPYDSDLCVKFKWDAPLLDGYEYEVLPAIGGTDRVTFWRPFNYGLARRLKDGRFDILWVHGYMRWFHWLAIANAKRLGIKVLLRDEATLISAPRGGVKRALKKFFFAALRRACDGFLAIGTLNRDYYRNQGVAEDKLFLVPYAVDNRFFSEGARNGSDAARLRTQLGFTEGKPVILTVARFVTRKRMRDLLEAYIRLSPDGVRAPEAYLVFAGNGAEREGLERRAAETGWQSIRFTGALQQYELRDYYGLADIFVLPSVHEPWGLVVNEAMNAGCAIVASDQVGCGRDLVKPGKNGYIFEAANIDDLSRALKALVDDPAQCQAMGEASREIIRRWSFEEDAAGLSAAVSAVLFSGASDGALSPKDLNGGEGANVGCSDETSG